MSQQHTEPNAGQPSAWMASFRAPYKQAKMYAGEYCTTADSARVLETYRLHRRLSAGERLTAFLKLGMQEKDARLLIERYDGLFRIAP